MSYSEKDLEKAVEGVFNSYDTDKSGTLEAQEVTNLINDALKQMKQRKKVTEEEVNQFIRSVDTDKDQKINKKELLEIFKKVVVSGKWLAFRMGHTYIRMGFNYDARIVEYK